MPKRSAAAERAAIISHGTATPGRGGFSERTPSTYTAAATTAIAPAMAYTAATRPFRGALGRAATGGGFKSFMTLGDPSATSRRDEGIGCGLAPRLAVELLAQDVG